MQKRWRNLLDSFRYAFRGLFYCIASQRNLRIHLVIAAYMAYFATFYQFGAVQYAILLVATALVIATEMVNTAIEALTDRFTPAFDNSARVAKDVAAGAVLICAIFSVFVGILLFWNIPTFALILGTITGSIRSLVLHIVSLAIALWFVFNNHPWLTGKSK